MPNYLFQVAYTPESWAAQLRDPKNRIDAIKPVMDKLGARVTAAYYAFGDTDLVFIADMPNNVIAAAVSHAFAAGGALRWIKTTPLMSLEEGIESLKKGADAASLYKPQR